MRGYSKEATGLLSRTARVIIENRNLQAVVEAAIDLYHKNCLDYDVSADMVAILSEALEEERDG
jgi:hypothetical protein